MIGDRADCPRCGRNIGLNSRRYNRHGTAPRSADTCAMTGQLVPTAGDRPDEYEHRADLVADLAWQVQDADPHQVWDYLTGIDQGELQRLLMVALAVVPVDATVDETFAWVNDLPVAQRYIQGIA